LIDGHNLIGRMPDIELSDPDDEARLVTRLRRHAARTGRKLTVVFDAGEPAGRSSRLSGGGVEVFFAPAGRSADSLIIKRIRRVQDRQGWLVISSDRAILEAAEQHRVRTRRSEEFAAELSPPQPPQDRRADPREVAPSEAEVEAWLREFDREA
jgi:hypothetical protein